MDTNETRTYLAVIIAVAVLGTILIYFFLSIIRQQRKNLELQKANALAEISAMEQERARIAADLHDELGPVLSVIKFQVDTVEQVSAEEKLQLKKASHSLDELIDKMRAVANNLMPVALHRKGLVAAIQEFTSNTNATGAIAINLLVSDTIVINEEKSINVYRVVQELVHNTMKHAGASVIDIVIEEKNNYLKLLFRDNGNGFDYPKLFRDSKGIGLRSIKNRTDIMGGTLNVESVKGKGTAFLFEIPLK